MEELTFKEYFEFNSKLQQKKNALRKELKERGILKRAGKNDYDHYKYFSEAQYKELFTDLFSKHALELKFDELEYNTFEGPEKQANGRMPKIEFSLIDVETGFSEETTITGEGIDKGDKAGYKAYTGALKYYLANTFMVATGDDPETESPSEKMNDKKERYATPNQLKVLNGMVQRQELNATAVLQRFNINSLKELTVSQASEIISGKKGH